MKVKVFKDIFNIYPEKQKKIKEKLIKELLVEMGFNKKDYNNFYNKYNNHSIIELKEKLKRLKFENQYTGWGYGDINEDYEKFCNS